MRLLHLAAAAVVAACTVVLNTAAIHDTVHNNHQHRHDSLYHHSSYQLKDSHAAPAVWRHDAAVPLDKDTHHVTLQIAVKRQQVDQLHALVMDVSSPTSSRYGQYLQKHEVDALVAPAAESLQHVTAWLQAHKVDLAHVTQSSNGDM